MANLNLPLLSSTTADPTTLFNQYVTSLSSALFGTPAVRITSVPASPVSNQIYLLGSGIPAPFTAGDVLIYLNPSSATGYVTYTPTNGAVVGSYIRSGTGSLTDWTAYLAAPGGNGAGGSVGATTVGTNPVTSAVGTIATYTVDASAGLAVGQYYAFNNVTGTFLVTSTPTSTTVNLQNIDGTVGTNIFAGTKIIATGKTGAQGIQGIQGQPGTNGTNGTGGTGGTGLSPWQFKSANYTVSAGDRLALDVTVPFNLTLPPTPTAGNDFDMFPLAGINLIGIDTGGKKFNGSVISTLKYLADSSVDSADKMVYVNDIVGWTSVRKRVRTVNNLTYATDGDNNGLFYYLGSGKGANTTFANPIGTNLFVIASTTESGTPGNLSDRLDNQWFSTPVANSWVTWDLGNTPIAVLKYTLRSRNTGGYYLRNWVLEGTNSLTTFDVTGVNTATWNIIDTKVNDTIMSTPGQYVTYTPNANNTNSYRYLRLRQNGASSDTNPTNTNYFVLNEVEFYGSIIAPVSPPTNTQPQTLSTFTVSTDGTKLNYAVVGQPLTAIVGNLILADASTRALTFVSSTQASIAGAPITSDITGMTVTISSSTPSLTSAVAVVAVANNSTVSSAPTPARNTLVLNCKFDGANGSTSFIDDYGATIAKAGTGNTAISTAQSKFGTGSLYIDGTPLVITSSVGQDKYNFDGQFTIQMWVYLPSTPPAQVNLFSRCDNVNGRAEYSLELTNYTTLGLYRGVRGSSDIEYAATVPALTPNAWNHIALTRDASGSIRFFANGVIGTGTTANPTDTNLLGDSNNQVYIGGFFPPYGLGQGLYIDSLEVDKGACLYAANFTPPTAPSPAPLPPTTDPLFSQVKLLLSLNNDLIDRSSTPKTFAIVGNTLPYSNGDPFGNMGKSLHVDGGTAAIATSLDFTIPASTDFCYEGWTRYTTAPNNTNGYHTPAQMYFLGLDSQMIAVLYSAYNNVNSWELVVNNALATTGAASIPTVGSWYFWQLQRSGSTIILYINGVAQFTFTYAGVLGNSGELRIGDIISGGDVGYGTVGDMAEVRLTVGATRPITVPTARFPTSAPTDPLIANVGLLLHLNTDFSDSSPAPIVVIPNSVAISTTQSKFGAGSARFDGTSNNYVTLPTATVFNVAAGDFTWEMWLWNDVGAAAGTSTERNILKAPGGSNGLSILPNRRLSWWQDNTGGMITGSTQPQLAEGAWHYIAVIRSGSAMTVWVDNAVYATFTLATSYNFSGWTLGVGVYNSMMLGYMDEIRFTNVARTITAAPTTAFPSSPPSAPSTLTGIPTAYSTSLWISGNSATANTSNIITAVVNSNNNGVVKAVTPAGTTDRTLLKTFDSTVNANVMSQNAGNNGYLIVANKATPIKWLAMVIINLAPNDTTFNQCIFGSTDSYPWHPTGGTPLYSNQGMSGAQNTANVYLDGNTPIQGINVVKPAAWQVQYWDLLDSTSAAFDFIGGRDRNDTYSVSYWHGKFAEIIVGTVALADADRQKIEGYLAWKYNLQANLPAGHPYKSAAPV